MIKSYPLQSHLNIKKEENIVDIISEYRKLAVKIANVQWSEFYKNQTFNKYLNLKTFSIKTPLSARYIQTCQVQVVGQLKSWVSNRNNDFKSHVYQSSLSDEVKRDLYILNKFNYFFKHEKFHLDKTEKDEELTIDLATVKLANIIIKEIFKKHKKPNMRYINMVLDSKVFSLKDNEEIFYKLNKKEKEKNKEPRIKQKSTSFDSWMSLSSLESGKRILIPFEENGYFQGKDLDLNGILKNSVQINLSKNKEMKFYFQKDLQSEKLRIKKEYKHNIKNNIKISLDLGLSVLFVSNSGHYYGKGFIDTLSKFDDQLMKLQKALIDKEKNTGIKVKFNDNQKYKKLVAKTNEYIKNTINYNMNLIIKNEKPSEIVIESLNFQSPHLSKKLNRIIGHFGKGLITKKFEEFKEIYGIKITEVNAAYTSQECNECGYINSDNRKNQEDFCCIQCNLIENMNQHSIKTGLDIKSVKIILKEETKTLESGKKKTTKTYYIEALDVEGKSILIKLNMKLVHVNADFNAAKNIWTRSSCSEKVKDIYGKRTEIRQSLVDIHLETSTVKNFILNPNKCDHSLGRALGLS